MNTQERIDLLVRLKDYLVSNDEELQGAKLFAQQKNPWFIQQFINLSIENIVTRFLEKNVLEQWLAKYKCNNNDKKKVGIVMAGNIPLVGFHDFMCVFLSGHNAIIKPSSKDDVLIKHIVKKLSSWNSTVEDAIIIAENLKGCDAYITTGSNNSGRYFEYYFGKYPSIIRKNRTSVAVLDGTETEEELVLLADDIQQYFGLGCRNVTKLLVPKGYDFVPLLNALKKYNYFIDLNKYKNNYDYQLALLMLNSKFYMTNESIILAENASLFAPVSQLNYEYYDEKDADAAFGDLKNSKDVQCIIGHELLPFGEAQSPNINDYADGVDTMQFLCELG